MRRGINIRKKKKLVLKEINKKALKTIALLIILLIFCSVIYFNFIQNIFIKKNLEQDSMSFSDLNENIPFSIKKLMLFSSATAESDSINRQLALDISQYCDVGIYLNKIEDENHLISSLYIDNIVMSSPEIGTPYLYKKNILDLGKCSFDENTTITDSLAFNIINTDIDLNYNNFEIYNNGTTPITLGFYNKNIKTNFMPDSSELFYNGTLLKEASIPLISLNSNISFRINIITNSNEHYICNINFDIPFETENGSIYDTGYITKEFNSNEVNKFIRIK